MEKEFSLALCNYDLSEKNIARLEEFADEIMRENKVHNLTRITQPKEVALKHFADSLAPLRKGLLDGCKNILDIGTGGGFPGIPLAIIGGMDVTLLDSSAKKLRILQEVSQRINLEVNVVNARAEEVATGEHRESFDAVVCRAVASLPIALELMAPFAKIGGRVLAYKADSECADQGDRAAKLLGLGKVESVDSEIEGLNHRLLVYEKIARTPKDYPRRYATIKANPL